ncbi:MAG: hypothetical protein ACOVQT_15905 [Rubrivivax sp.]
MSRIPPPVTLPPDVVEALQEGQTIEAIKRLRAHGKMGLKEAKEVIDAAAQAGYDKPVNAAASASDLVKPGRAPGEVPASRSRLVLWIVLALVAALVWTWWRGG